MGKKTVKKTTIIEEEVISNEKTEIVCILDRSGSMYSIIDDAIGGFNKFLDDQKKLADKANITVSLFDNEYNMIYDDVDISKCEEINKGIWSPRGSTALYDAIGKSINHVNDKIKKQKKKDRADKVLVVIVTDGYENSSKEYNLDTINKLIKDYEKKDWQFIYLAANQDAFSVGRSMGISGSNSMSFDSNSRGVNTMYDSLTNATSFYRTASLNSDEFKSKKDSLLSKDESKEK